MSEEKLIPGLRSFADALENGTIALPPPSTPSPNDLQAARQIMDRFARGKLDKGEQAYLDALSDLVAFYETLHVEFPKASDADMLRHLLDTKGVTQTQLHRETGI